MSLTRLDNLYSSKTGKYLYVSPDDFNATDTLDNRGNSPLRPFKTIQRAFLEVARFSYQPGANNDRFDQFSIMLMPGDHYIDNRPGLVNYSIGGNNADRNRFYDAGNLLEENKLFIAYEAYAKMLDYYVGQGTPFGGVPTGQVIDCIDDVIDVIDEIIYNVKFGGNDRTFDAALVYQNLNITDPQVIGNEQEETIRVYQYASEIAQSVIANETISTLYQGAYLAEIQLVEPYEQKYNLTLSVGPSVAGGTGADIDYGQVDTCSDVKSAISTLFAIIEEGLLGLLITDPPENPGPDVIIRQEPETFGELPVFNFDQSAGQWNDNSIIDLSNPDNIFYKFNASTGGAIVPRGCSLVGYDLRRTIVRPLYVPDPADSNQGRTSIFNLTGGCYIWQFTIKDGDLTSNSPLFDPSDNVGKVYYQKGNVTNLAVPEYSHHKITIMEYAENAELDAYYEKVAIAFQKYQPTIVQEGEFDPLVQENRIVGPLSDTRSIQSIEAIDANIGQPSQKLILKVTTRIDHGYFKDQYVAILNTGLDEETNGTFKIASINANNPREFTYEILGKVAAGLGLVNGQVYSVGAGLSSNAVAQAEIDSVESASPYVFNCSIRSTWGQCGMWADGSKSTGFRSMVVAQYTGVSLQKDDRAFIRYDEFTNTWNQASLTDAFATVPYHTKGDAYWKDDWRNFHIRASNDSFIQCVSVFAVGFFDHFLMESGGDMSITNSNSNFGNTSLHAIGHKGYAFNQDKGGYITDIIPPQELSGGYSENLNPNVASTNSAKIPYYPIDITTSNDPNNATRLYLGSDAAYDPAQRPAATINGYRIGARPDEQIFLKLEERPDTTDTQFSAVLSPTGVESYTTSIQFLNPTGLQIDNVAQDAANLINANREFIQDEVYGYITTKYPDLLSAEKAETITIATCRRDIGYYVDAVVQDLKLGGNINTVQAAEAYFVGGQLTYIQNEQSETADALDLTKDLCIAAMRNFDFLVTGNACTAGSDLITMPGGVTGIVVGMKVQSYAAVSSNNTEPSGLPSNIIPADSYVVEIVDNSTIRIGEKGQYVFGSQSFDPNAGNSVEAQSSSGNLTLWFTLRDETLASPSDGVQRDGIFSNVRTSYDDSVIQDIVGPGESECSEIASVINQYFVDIKTILSSPFGEDGVDRIEPDTDFSQLSKRATLFTVAGGNPHQMETGTAVRLVPKAIPGTNPDPRLIRLPKGFDTNTKYYVIAPARKTSPFDYSTTTAFDQTSPTVFMLASTPENARAGNYIYSPETDAIDSNVYIEVNKYIIDQKFDLYQYDCTLEGTTIRSALTHSIDIPIDGVEPQKVFIRPFDNVTPVPNKTVGQFVIPVSTQDEYYVRYIDNNRFNIFTSFADALTGDNAVSLSGNTKFKVFSSKRFSPLKFDPKPTSNGLVTSSTGQWYLQCEDRKTNPTDILGRIAISGDVTYSGPSPAESRSNDTFFERVNDERIPEDRIYKLRYVIPSYLETVRDPLNGFVIKARTDTKRRLRPQKIVLKPVIESLHSSDESYSSKSVATFVNSSTFNVEYQNTSERLGFSKRKYYEAGVSENDIKYDPYANPRILRTKLGKIDFTIQSARVITQTKFDGSENVDYKYLEITAFDHTLEQPSIKDERFVVVEISAPQGAAGTFASNVSTNGNANSVQWTGASSGTGYVHAILTTSNPVATPKSDNGVKYYLIIKGIETGSIKYNPLVPTVFTQPQGVGISATLLGKPDSIGDPDGASKSAKEDYLYSVKGANIYSLVPGDIITADDDEDYYIDTVEDAGEIEDTFYIFDIQELKERIPGQQDGIYYLICLKGNVSPYPTGAGVGQNFRDFKFSQPISYLYPQDYKNDPFWFEQLDQDFNDPPATSSAADNYVHGLVTVNDARYSETKEVINFLKENPALSSYEYDNYIDPDYVVGDEFDASVDARIRAQSGNAVSGAEDRKIPIKGNNQYPTDSKLYVELRRPSIARSGNHTFEYLGFGPGNYSTGFPLRQEVILTDSQDFYAQSKREDGGIVFYTGLNSNGDLYIGNKKVNAITGEETFLESAQLIGSEDEDDNVGDSFVTTFETPVTFNNKITVNGPAAFTKPITLSIAAEDIVPPSYALQIQSNVDSSTLGEDPTLSRSNFQVRTDGDITLSKNRIQSAIFSVNPRGNTSYPGQRYTFKTHYATESSIARASNLTPSQFVAKYDINIASTLSSNRLFDNQVVYYGNVNNTPVPGDVLFKGKEIGDSGSLGWIYANTYVDIPNEVVSAVATPKQDELGNIGIQLGLGSEITPLPLVRLIWANQDGSPTTNADLRIQYGLISESFIRVSGITGDLEGYLNGIFPIYQDTFNDSSTFIDVVVATPIAEYDILETWSNYPFANVSVSNSQWREMGVIGSESIRTNTNALGNYKLGINTVSRSAHSAYLNGYVDKSSDRTTDPRANLDVVGNAFISGTSDIYIDPITGNTQSEYKNAIDPANRTKRYVENAFLVGGDEYSPDDHASFRIATGHGTQTERETKDGRVGINLTNDQLNGTADAGIYNKALAVNGPATISGNVRFERNLELNGAAQDDYDGTYGTAALTSRATTFNLIDTDIANNVINLSMGGSIANIEMFHDYTGDQVIKIGSLAGSQLSTSTTEFTLHAASRNSVINLGVVDNTPGNSSLITIGGAINTGSDSEFFVRNFKTTLAGKLIIRGGASDQDDTGIIEGEGIQKFNFLPAGVVELNIGDSATVLNLAGVSGTTQVRNSLLVQGSAEIRSDITLEGGLRNSNIQINRNVFGSINIISLQRDTNLVTVTTENPHQLAQNQLVEVLTSDFSFNTAGTVPVASVPAPNQFTYIDVDTDLPLTAATGTVITGIGLSQATGSVDDNNFNIDFYAKLENIASLLPVANFAGGKLLLDFNYLNANDPIFFTDIGNLTGVSAFTTYYVFSSDSAGIFLKANLNDVVELPIGIDPAAGGDVGSATIVLAQTAIDTQGNDPWGGSDYDQGNGVYRLYINNPNGLATNRYLLVGTEVLLTVGDPSPLYPFYIDVVRARDNTKQQEHADGSRIYLLSKQESATLIFPNALLPGDTLLNIGEFSATIQNGDLFLLNPGTQSAEWVEIIGTNPSDAQRLVVNDGDFGTEFQPFPARETFKVVSSTGNTRIIGDLTIGYDTSVNSLLDDDSANSLNINARSGISSSLATGAGAFQTGGGNLRVHNSIELSGTSIETLPERQYFLITDGQYPVFFTESATGDTSIFEGGSLRIYSDKYYTGGGWDKGRDNEAELIKFEVQGDTGNSLIAGTLRIGNDLNVGTLVDPNAPEGGANVYTSRFSIDAQTGSLNLGNTLTVGGITSATPSAGVPIFTINGLGENGNSPFVIKQDSSVDAFGEENYLNENGGRKTVFVSAQGNTDATSIQLKPNIQYAVRPSSNLILRLPGTDENVQTGDMVRIVDIGGALNFGVNLVIRADTSVPIQGNVGGTTLGGRADAYNGGELIINTPNAAFGLIYLGTIDGDGNTIPGVNQGWFLMEI